MAKKQKSGLYRARIKIGTGADGKDIYKYVSGRTKKELEAAREEALRHYVLGNGRANDRIFGEYAVEWYRIRKEPRLSASSREGYRTALNLHILPVFGDRRLRAITALDIQEFINDFEGASRTKITMIMATLTGIFDAACADRIIERSPAEHVQRPIVADAVEKRALTVAERERLENVCARDERGIYLACMYYLGLRPGEARGLQWGDVDWAQSIIHIQRDIDYKEHGQAGKLKTSASDRRIPIPSILMGLMIQQRGTPLAYINAGERTGQALSKAAAERIWIRLMIAAGLAEERDARETYGQYEIRGKYRATITPHILRHNYITMCWEHGIDAYTTMRLVGHTSIKTTMDIYTHLSEAQTQKVAVELEDIFKPRAARCNYVAQGVSEGGSTKK